MTSEEIAKRFYKRCADLLGKKRTFNALPPEAIRNSFQIFRYVLKEFKQMHGEVWISVIINYGNKTDHPTIEDFTTATKTNEDCSVDSKILDELSDTSI